MASIGIDYTPAYEQGGGIGRYVRELVSALVSLDQHNQYALFVSGAVSSQIPDPPAANVVWKPTTITPKWLARIWHRAQIPLPIETFVGRVSLYHATDFVLPPVRPSTITVLTVHDLSFVRVQESASPSLKLYLDRVVPRSIQRASFVLADSEATRKDLIEVYGVPVDKVLVLLSGVHKSFSPVNDTSGLMTTRTQYGIGGISYIFTVGTVQPRKNYVRLIQALALLHLAGIDIHLVISGGKGWLDDPIYAAIDHYQMREYVHFIGFAEDRDLPALYSGATCFAFPSLYEGFGLPVLEAMACGVPVLTSNVSSLPEVAGDAALLVDPYDVEAIAFNLQRLIQDSELRTDLIQKGFAQARKFTWENSARELLKIYNSLLP